MNKTRSLKSSYALLLGAVFFAGFCGCQTNIGGQTLPSAYYLRDDVQYFPAGPEFLLPNTKRAIEEYNAAKVSENDISQAYPGQ